MNMTALAPGAGWLVLLGLAAPRAAGDAEPPSLDQAFAAAGLVDVTVLEPHIRVELKYSTPDNFLHADVYGDLGRCYLQKEVAQKLAAAQQALAAKHPGWSLLTYDCARPRRVQYKMWDLVKDTGQEPYVAPPASGSIHNFGAAVDLTVTDAEGRPLDMGTPFDFFGDLAQPRYEERFFKEGKLTAAQWDNRKILRRAMNAAGFHGKLNEWWHFEAASFAEVKAKYQIIE